MIVLSFSVLCLIGVYFIAWGLIAANAEYAEDKSPSLWMQIQIIFILMIGIAGVLSPVFYLLTKVE